MEKPTKERTENVCLCMEIENNVVIDKKIYPYEDDTAMRYVRERVEDAQKRDFVPDNDLVVVKGREGYLKGWGDYICASQMIPDVAARHYFSVEMNVNMQLATHILENGGTDLSWISLKLAGSSPEFKDFQRQQSEKQWDSQEKLILSLPPEKRPDDWSFICELSDRKYTDKEKIDITSLGLIMSTGMDTRLLTPERVPSLEQLRPHYNDLWVMLYGETPLGWKDIPLQKLTIKAEAGGVLSKKYPEIAETMKEMCGLPSGSKNEAYALVDSSGKAAFAAVSTSDIDGFLSFFSWHHFIPEQDRADVWNWQFEKYQFDVPMPELAGSAANRWQQVTDLARRDRIEPTVLNYTDVRYCLENGRNPLHPENSREKLMSEKAYVEYCKEMRPIVNRSEAQKNKITPHINPYSAKKKGRGLI